MEKVALAPLHILLGLVNKLFSEAKPNHKPSNRKGRHLYKLRCLALCKYNVYRSEYWNVTLEGNSCSRLLDHLEDNPFPNISENFVKALKAFKDVKDDCLGKVRNTGWKDSIRTFREAWQGTGLPWSLKSHILSDHYSPVLKISPMQVQQSVQKKVGKCYIPRYKRCGIYDSRLRQKIPYFPNVLWIAL